MSKVKWKEKALLVGMDSEGVNYLVEYNKGLSRLLSWGSSWTRSGEVLVEETGTGFYFPDLGISLYYSQVAYCYHLVSFINKHKDCGDITADCQAYYKDIEDVK